MSRVYEALKRAEQQRLAEESRSKPAYVGNGPIQPAGLNGTDAHLELLVEERRPRTELVAVEKPSVIRPASVKSTGRGPLLLVGQPDHVVDAEPFHLLALSLQSWTVENQKRCLTVTSALSGDGKSFVALNLAASLAMLGGRVLLVDADLRRPVLHHSFNLAPLHGLEEYLSFGCEFDACLHSTSIPGLTLVPAGGISNTPTELFARPRAGEFIKKARALSPEHYIIVDSPAASMVPEPQILNRLVDALVIVVAANQTPREVVKQTIENLSGSEIFGLVLNRYEAPRSARRNYPAAYARRRNSGRKVSV